MHAARELNMPIDQWRGSEDMLGRRGIFSMSSVKDSDIADLASRVINQADAPLLSKTGHVSYAGSRFSNAEDALSMVKRHQHLLEELSTKPTNHQGVGTISRSKSRAMQRADEADDVGYSCVNRWACCRVIVWTASRVIMLRATITKQIVQLAHRHRKCSVPCQQRSLNDLPAVRSYYRGRPCGFGIVCSQCDAEVRGGKLWNKGIGRTAARTRNAQKKLFGSDTIQPLHQKKTRSHQRITCRDHTSVWCQRDRPGAKFIIGGKGYAPSSIS